MPQYALFLYDAPDCADDIAPEEMQSIIREYGQWAQDLGARGQLLGGHKLTEDPGQILRNDGGVTDGPFIETKEYIGGIFVIAAASDEEALAIARSCPHAARGYSAGIEIRRIDDVSTGDCPD